MWHWKGKGLDTMIHSVGWRDGEPSFTAKLKRLVDIIDCFIEQGDRVSLVGTSAGGSAALNAFIERKDTVHRVINVCGRLRTGPTTGFRSFESKTSSSLSFRDSVILCEGREKELSATDSQRIMTVTALFGDELVPPDTIALSGAYNIAVPMLGHSVSIGAALTVFSRPLIAFLQK